MNTGNAASNWSTATVTGLQMRIQRGNGTNGVQAGDIEISKIDELIFIINTHFASFNK